MQLQHWGVENPYPEQAWRAAAEVIHPLKLPNHLNLSLIEPIEKQGIEEFCKGRDNVLVAKHVTRQHLESKPDFVSLVEASAKLRTIISQPETSKQFRVRSPSILFRGQACRLQLSIV